MGVSSENARNAEPHRIGLTWKSPRFDAEAYKKLTEVNCMAEYKLIYLKQLKLVTNAARPSLWSVSKMFSCQRWIHEGHTE